MARIIYIAGLGHSGSTILDMSLATLPGVIGLGEIKTLIDDRTRENHMQSLCSCGRKATDCIFWSKVPSALEGINSFEKKYEALINLVSETFGKDCILIDSSKNSYNYLAYLNQNHDLKTIYLTRDIRSWSYSRHLSTKKPVLYFAFRWFLENKKLGFSFKGKKIGLYRVGYEELAIQTEYIMKSICKLINVEYSDKMLSPDLTNSHIISGNIARVDSDKRKRWSYDSRWFLSRRIMLLSPIFFLFSRMNRKNVYPNLSKSSIENFELFGTRRKNDLDRKFN